MYIAGCHGETKTQHSETANLEHNEYLCVIDSHSVHIHEGGFHSNVCIYTCTRTCTCMCTVYCVYIIATCVYCTCIHTVRVIAT